MNKNILCVLIYFSAIGFLFSQNSLKWVIEGSLHGSIQATGISYSFNPVDINNINYDEGVDPFLWGHMRIRTSSGALDSADFEILVDSLQINFAHENQLTVYNSDSSMDLQTGFNSTPLTQTVRLRFNLFEYGTRTNISYAPGTGGTPKNMPIGFSAPNQNPTNIGRFHSAETYYFETASISGPVPCTVIDSCMQIDTFIAGQAFSDMNPHGEDIHSNNLNQAKNNGTYPYNVTGGRTYIRVMEAQSICDDGDNAAAIGELHYNVYFPEVPSFIIGRQDIRKSGGNGTGIKSAIGFSLSPLYEPITVILPIELEQWETKVENDNDVHLFWTTASETNNDRFEIEHSLDGINFRLLSTIKGAGTSTELHNYHYKIENLLGGTHYFRLKQIDFDGTVNYSSIKVERIKGNTKQVMIYPNILQKESILYAQTTEPGMHYITMYTISGQLVHSFRQNLSPIQANTLAIDLAKYKAGLYLLKIEHKAIHHIAKIQLH